MALAALLVGVWFIRSIPRTLSALAIAVLLALALNPVVEAVQRRTSWSRRPAVAVVLTGVAAVITLILVLVVPATIRQVRDFNDQVPKVVKNLDEIPKGLRKDLRLEFVRDVREVLRVAFRDPIVVAGRPGDRKPRAKRAPLQSAH